MGPIHPFFDLLVWIGVFGPIKLLENYVVPTFLKLTYLTQKGLLYKALWLGRQTYVIGTEGISTD